VTSPQAVALRVALLVTQIAEGIEIRFFSPEDPARVWGPYTDKELISAEALQEAEPFWSPVMEGDTIGIEIFLPEGRRPQELSLSIPKVSHLWLSPEKSSEKRLSDMGASGACNVDVACNPAWVNTANSVVKYVWTSYQYVYMCTGTLLADTDPSSYVPYFLTSNHCINNQSDAGNINTYWFFQKSACGGPNPTTVTQQTGGATLLATSTSADFSFLRLNNIIPPQGAVFSGWSIGAVAPGTAVVGIHHPSADLKKISLGTVSGYAPWSGSVNGTGDHIRVFWSSGVTEEGSSGSGLWVSSGDSQYLVGMLHGGGSSCSNPTEPDWYGRFDVAYESISLWLDPPPPSTPLDNSVPASGLSGASGSRRYFFLAVPRGATSLKVTTTGGTGDISLYVKSGSLPTVTSYTCMSQLPGNDEACTMVNPAIGGWYVLIRSNAAYSGVTLTATYTAPPSFVDLVVSKGPTVNPTSICPGGWVEVSPWAVQNQGSLDSGTFRNGYFLSTDPIITLSDTYLGENANPSLAPGASYNWNSSLSQRFMIPTATTPGNYYIGILLDGTNTVAETNELNNYFSVPLTVLSSCPDLVISSGSPSVKPYTVFAGGTVEVAPITVKNQGAAASPAFEIAYYFPTTSSSYQYNTYLGGGTNPPLAAGAITEWGARTFTVPKDTPPGSYSIQLFVDPANTVGESNDTNNVQYSGSFSVVAELLNGISYSVPKISMYTYYYISVPPGSSSMIISTSGGTGDVDLYVKSGTVPTPYSSDCRSATVSSNAEKCTIANPAAGIWQVLVYAPSVSFSGVTITASYSLLRPGDSLNLTPGGAASAATAGLGSATWAGYSTATVNSGAPPYATAVFSFKQNGNIVTEAGVPASPPTTLARVFIDYRSGVLALPGRIGSGAIQINTGIALVNPGTVKANIAYTLRDLSGRILSTGSSTLTAGNHIATFINQLADLAPNFALPPSFQSTVQFASLEISSDQPISVLALRGTINQRNEFLLTTTPVVDLKRAVSYAPLFFPHFADGGGYTTSIVLLNTTDKTEGGSLQVLDNKGAPLVVNQAGGKPDSSFRYSIPAGGAYRFQTNGSSAGTSVGWVRVLPDSDSPTPVGSGVFSYNPGTIMISESGIPSAVPTTHARIYVDLSGKYNTGLAIANVVRSGAIIKINAFQNDGVTPAGASPSPLGLDAYGHDAKFATQFITGLVPGFTGLLDISSTTPFAALTMRSLVNERGDFLMTTFPIADANSVAPSPIIFPQVADGGGYTTQFILISASGEASTTLRTLLHN
jgi:hypothetical protein